MDINEYIERSKWRFASGINFLAVHMNDKKIHDYRRDKKIDKRDLNQMRIDFKLLDEINKIFVSESMGGKRNFHTVFKMLEDIKEIKTSFGTAEIWLSDRHFDFRKFKFLESIDNDDGFWYDVWGDCNGFLIAIKRKYEDD